MLEGMEDLDTAPDLMQLLEQLQEQVIELAAIKQAATDFIKADCKHTYPITCDELAEIRLTHAYLKSLVYE